MRRSLTDYSHQTLGDIVGNLKDWLLSLKKICASLENDEAKLQTSTYWSNIDPNVLSILAYSKKFYTTSITEISEILENMEREIEDHHAKRLKSLAQTAIELNKRMGSTWHEERRPWKEYGNPDFSFLEGMYAEARDMAVDMMDLGSVACRLEDFIGRKGTVPNNSQHEPASLRDLSVFVDSSRISQLRQIASQQFDLSKLIQICEELNKCYANECYLAVAMLVRAILDHVPPIFGYASFIQVSNNYGGRSFRELMEHLEKSLRKIADAYLHEHIQNTETLPNKTQINFSNDLDVLLAEIVRILR